MSNKKQCNFEPSSQTSSSTICKWCGKEKWQHILLMSNKKQTAVEWLEEKAKEFAIDLDLLNYFQQAKELEKQQIYDAFDDGNYAYGMGIKEPEQYYTETYEN